MNTTDSILTVLISGLMGILGGFISIPLNAYVMWRLKKNEQYYQHKLDLIAKQRELLLQHKLEMKRIENEYNDINKLKQSLKSLEIELSDIKSKMLHPGSDL